MGVVLVLVGGFLINGAAWARVVAIIIVGLHMIAQFASVSAYPLWGVIAIALDAIILYALLVHGREIVRGVTELATSPPPAARHRVRRAFTWVLIVLAALLVGIGSVAVWATRTVFNDDRFSATVTDVVSDPGVISAASTYLTDQIGSAVDSSGILKDLPPAIQPVVNVLRGAVRSRVEEGVSNVLSSDAGQALMIGAARTAHSRAMRILEGDGLLSSSAVTIENGTVTLNLLPVARQVMIQLQEGGVIPSSVSIPTDTSTPGPIASALGVTLPDDFGQVVVYQTDAVSGDGILDQAQRALVLSKRGVVLLVILALAACAGAILLAVERRRTVFRLGAAITIVSVLLIISGAAHDRPPSPTSPRPPAGVPWRTPSATRCGRASCAALVIVAIVAVAMAIGARVGDRLVPLTRKAVPTWRRSRPLPSG